MQEQPKPPTSKGPADRFTGDVYVDMVVANPDAGFSVGAVHFTPGAHTAWHSHAAGQMLHCLEGVGVVVTAEEVIVLRPGVTVWTPPNQRHWHGAAPEELHGTPGHERCRRTGRGPGGGHLAGTRRRCRL